jgi:hypothetical protein
MIARLRPRLTYANVMATIAVFIALGGGAYAANKIKLPKNAVGGKQIKKNAVTSKKVKNHTLKAEDAKAGQFALPGDLSGYLPKGATAANAAALGGVGPGGFVKGGGRRLSATYNGDSRLVGVPGGSIQLQCASSSYKLFFKPDAGQNQTFDVYLSVLRPAGANATVFYYRHDADTIVLPLEETDPTHTTFDISSDAGYAQLTVFVAETASSICHASARGYSTP